MLIASACSRQEFVSLDEQVRKEYSIAVVLPMSNGKGDIWYRSIDWALENLNKELIPQRRIRIKAEWYDEDTVDMDVLFSGLCRRDDIKAIVGPLYSRNSEIAARHCSRYGKILFPALSTSAQLMRAYAGEGFLWCLAENDISQCEVLLSRALQKGAKKVSLLSCDDSYGQTFIDWFAFQAKELGLQVRAIEIYSDEKDAASKLENLLGSDTDCIICIPMDDITTKSMNDVRIKHNHSSPFLLFSDGAFLNIPDGSFEGMEGIVQTYDPTSGFHINFEARYGIAPQYGNAHFYDATILAGLAILMADVRGSHDLSDAMISLVSMKGKEINNCSAENIGIIIGSLLAGRDFHITGACGELYFPQDYYTNVLHSIYCHWIVYQGEHLILEYNTSDAGNRTDASAANWNWRVKFMQNFTDNNGLEYAKARDLCAIIVASSSGWNNYRHQANAFAMYQLLKNNGMDDEHIIMIAEDDLAYNEANPYKGSIRLSDDGENVYSQEVVDYILSSTTWDEISDMLLSEEETAFATDSLTNLIVYWSGHGSSFGLNWSDETIPTQDIAVIFKELAENSRFRKALLLIEACYSGRLGIDCQGIPGLLCITAANDLETSKANRYSPAYGTWMSNSFSESLLNEFTKNKDVSFFDLYTELYNKTIGSHVSVYNADNFDNLYSSSISEFIYPNFSH